LVDNGGVDVFDLFYKVHKEIDGVVEFGFIGGSIVKINEGSKTIIL